MKRAIIPIIIENSEIKISSYAQLVNIFETDKETYNSLLASGDAQRMSFAYSKETPCAKDTEYDSSGMPHLGELQDPFKQEGKAMLLGIEYCCSLKSVTQDVKIIGMHRHKTLISLEGQVLEVCSRVSLRYSLVKNVTFVVKNGAKLRLSNCMLDQIYVIVENGGIIELNDVEFSNMDTECVHLHKGATVGMYKNVRFFDTHKRFKVDYANLQETGLLIDFTETQNIIDFIETSIVRQIELIGDFKLPNAEIEIKQSIDFVNVLNDEIIVDVKSITTSGDLRFLGNIKVDSHINIQECSSINLCLGNFIGTTTIEDSDLVHISSTSILGQKTDKKVFTITSSKVVFSQLFIQNSIKPIFMTESEIEFKASSFSSVVEVCKVFEKEVSEDSLLFESAKRKNSILIDDCKIEATLFIESNKLDILNVKSSKLNNNRLCFNLIGCRSIKIEELQSEKSDCVIKMNDCNAHVMASHFKGGDRAIEFAHSHVHLEHTHVTHYQHGVHVESGVLKISHTSLNYNKFGAYLSGKECRIEHYDCDFDGNEQRALMLRPGSETVDLKEVEELESCQVL